MEENRNQPERPCHLGPTPHFQSTNRVQLEWLPRETFWKEPPWEQFRNWQRHSALGNNSQRHSCQEPGQTHILPFTGRHTSFHPSFHLSIEYCLASFYVPDQRSGNANIRGKDLMKITVQSGKSFPLILPLLCQDPHH